MEYGEEADFRAEVLGIGRDGAQGLGGGPEEDVENRLFVLISEGFVLTFWTLRGGELSPGTAGPRDRVERVPSASAGGQDSLSSTTTIAGMMP